MNIGSLARATWARPSRSYSRGRGTTFESQSATPRALRLSQLRTRAPSPLLSRGAVRDASVVIIATAYSDAIPVLQSVGSLGIFRLIPGTGRRSRTPVQTLR